MSAGQEAVDPMQIWIDADACPVAIKQILYRAAERVGVPLLLVANQPLKVPPSAFVRSVQVASGFDVADRYIADHVAAGDILVTADIPLAAEVIAKGGRVVTPRGERLTPENIGERLTVRDLMDELRGSGVVTGGPPAFGARDKQTFANALDRLLARR